MLRRLPEFHMWLLGIPMSTRQRPSLSADAEENILKSLNAILNGRNLSKRQRQSLFTAIAAARIAHRRLRRTDGKPRKWEGFLEWGDKQNRSLERVRLAAAGLINSLESCDQFTKLQFYHASQDGSGYRELFSMAKTISCAIDEAYRQGPPIGPHRRPDYAFNALVSNLCLGWCNATGLPLSRSTNKDRAPVAFIAAVCKELELDVDETRIQSAIRWLLRHRAKKAKQAAVGSTSTTTV